MYAVWNSGSWNYFQVGLGNISKNSWRDFWSFAIQSVFANSNICFDWILSWTGLAFGLYQFIPGWSINRSRNQNSFLKSELSQTLPQCLVASHGRTNLFPPNAGSIVCLNTTWNSITLSEPSSTFDSRDKYSFQSFLIILWSARTSTLN